MAGGGLAVPSSASMVSYQLEDVWQFALPVVALNISYCKENSTVTWMKPGFINFPTDRTTYFKKSQNVFYREGWICSH